MSPLLLVSDLRVGHPAAGLDLVTVQAPVLQLLLEEGPAHVSGVVQLSRPAGQHTRVIQRKFQGPIPPYSFIGAIVSCLGL
jgi:hypothetical protein